MVVGVVGAVGAIGAGGFQVINLGRLVGAVEHGMNDSFPPCATLPSLYCLDLLFVPILPLPQEGYSFSLSSIYASARMSDHSSSDATGQLAWVVR